MNLRAVRTDLAVVARAAGYTAFDFQPDDLAALPAAVVGSPRAMVRRTRTVSLLTLPVAFYVSTVDPATATAALDLVLSHGEDGSFLTLLEDASLFVNRPAWDTAVFASAGPYQHVEAVDAASVELVLELAAQ